MTNVSVGGAVRVVLRLDKMHTSTRLRALKETLDKIEIPGRLNDPVEYVRRFRSPDDAEIAGLLIAGIAYGKVAQVLRNAGQLLDIFGDGPARFVAGFDSGGASRFDGFEHRFTRGAHVACMVLRMKRALDDYGSLQALFRSGWDRNGEMRFALSDFARRLRAYPCPGFCDDCRTPGRQSVRWLLSEPGNGSAAKRMCLFVRWMVRTRYPDVGAWNDIPSSALVIPLDTHVSRIGRLLGLTRRRSSGWATAVEITDALKQLDPEDPLRYDYSLSHLGIDGGCSGRFDRARCFMCPMKQFCTVARRAESHSIELKA